MTTTTPRSPGDARPLPKRPFYAGPWTKWRVLKWLAVFLLIAALIASLFAWNFYRGLYRGMPELPTTAELWSKGREPGVEFVDLEGKTLAIRGPRYGRAVKTDLLPDHVKNAFIAAEDKRFYEHNGADNAAIARAAWSNVTSGETVSGASTITQQLIKNLVLTPEQTLSRKAQEVRLARQLEKRLSKAEILDLYMNRMYFGAGFYGIDAASTHYFGKEPADLSLSESALLAALLQAPSRLALTGNMENAKARQRLVLSRMVEGGFIGQAEADAASAAEVQLVERAATDETLGWALDLAQEQVKTLLPSAPSDLIITLTLDAELQGAAHAAIKKRMESDGVAAKATEVSALVVHPDGRVLCLIGGLDYQASQFNRVTQAMRQPGSAFKAFVYAAALEDGISPYDIRYDAPLTIGKWSPQNYSGRFIGPVTVGEAYAESLNTVAAQLTQDVSERDVIAVAKRFGVTADLQPFPSIALGSQEVTLWDMTRAFGVFMNSGKRLDPYLIAKIENSRGDTLYERPDYEAPQVFKAELVGDMNTMMAAVVSRGTGGRARIPGWETAGKTGTSQDWRDAWFMGFTGARVGGVWVGNDDDSPMARVTGGGLPADLWRDIMVIAHSGVQAIPVPGAGKLPPISAEAQRRIAFYRDMSMSFAVVANR